MQAKRTGGMEREDIGWTAFFMHPSNAFLDVLNRIVSGKQGLYEQQDRAMANAGLKSVRKAIVAVLCTTSRTMTLQAAIHRFEGLDS